MSVSQKKSSKEGRSTLFAKVSTLVCRAETIRKYSRRAFAFEMLYLSKVVLRDCCDPRYLQLYFHFHKFLLHKTLFQVSAFISAKKVLIFFFISPRIHVILIRSASLRRF